MLPIVALVLEMEEIGIAERDIPATSSVYAGVFVFTPTLVLVIHNPPYTALLLEAEARIKFLVSDRITVSPTLAS